MFKNKYRFILKSKAFEIAYVKFLIPKPRIHLRLAGFHDGLLIFHVHLALTLLTPHIFFPSPNSDLSKIDSINYKLSRLFSLTIAHRTLSSCSSISLVLHESLMQNGAHKGCTYYHYNE